ncbi:MAG TPA: maleylpyruvate isomerase family mycothiol-dependent enzyme [Acidimicrobiales bacterium]|nr:maleylpyruvate isomerase family mycothiol-dependent enzyme [Acidimicrobiales bacterium]
MPTRAVEPVVAILDEEWHAISALAQELADVEWDLPSECPGWSVRDVLAHMIGTERWLLGEPEPDPLPDVPDFVRNDLGASNEAWVAQCRPLPAGAVADEFRAVTARRLDEMRSWPEERFAAVGPSPVGPVPYREFMRVRAMDCWVHEQDMRVATGRPGHCTGPVAQLALGRLASGMPFVVGKQAAAPEGSCVRFELRGPVLGRLDVAVRGGRASIVTAGDDETGAVLELDDEVFWRLACGRVTGAAARDAGLVVVHGDADLARRVLDAMAFMV